MRVENRWDYRPSKKRGRRRKRDEGRARMIYEDKTRAGVCVCVAGPKRGFVRFAE